MRATFYGMCERSAYRLESFLKQGGISYHLEDFRDDMEYDIAIVTDSNDIGIGCNLGAELITMTAFVGSETRVISIDTSDFERLVII